MSQRGSGSEPPASRRRQSPSPPPRRGRQRDGPHQTVVQRTVKEASSSMAYPLLTKTNYPEWALVMRVSLQAQGLWRAVEFGNTEYSEDRLALAVILRAVPPEMLASLALRETAKEAWEAVKTVRLGVERVRTANAQKLRKEFNNIEFKPGETVDDFSMRLSGLVNNLMLLNDVVPDAEVVRKMLQVAPERFDQVVISIETLLDIEKMTLDEVTGRLRAVEQRYEARVAAVDEGTRLLLSVQEEELITRLREKRSGGSRSNTGGGGGRYSGNTPRRGSPQFGHARDQPRDDNRETPKRDKCRYCGYKGHWARDCRKKKREEAANLVQESDDEEPALLMAQVVEYDGEPEHVGTPDLLNKQRATVEFRDEPGGPDRSKWYIDT